MIWKRQESEMVFHQHFIGEKTLIQVFRWLFTRLLAKYGPMLRHHVVRCRNLWYGWKGKGYDPFLQDPLKPGVRSFGPAITESETLLRLSWCNSGWWRYQRNTKWKSQAIWSCKWRQPKTKFATNYWNHSSNIFGSVVPLAMSFLK